MKLLSIDQSSKLNGYAIFEDGKLMESGVYQALGKKFEERLINLGEWLDNTLKNNNIQKVCFEEVQYQTKDEVKIEYTGDSNHNTFKRLAQVQGVFIYICLKNKVSFDIISPSIWRKGIGITDIYRAKQKEKAQMKVLEWYKKKCGDDEAEAICIGRYSCRKEKVHKII